MKLLMPLSIRIKQEFFLFLRANDKNLMPEQKAALNRYMADNFILELMAVSFFEEWWETGRNFSLEVWSRKAAADILAVYK